MEDENEDITKTNDNHSRDNLNEESYNMEGYLSNVSSNTGLPINTEDDYNWGNDRNDCRKQNLNYDTVSAGLSYLGNHPNKYQTPKQCLNPKRRTNCVKNTVQHNSPHKEDEVQNCNFKISTKDISTFSRRPSSSLVKSACNNNNDSMELARLHFMEKKDDSSYTNYPGNSLEKSHQDAYHGNNPVVNSTNTQQDSHHMKLIVGDLNRNSSVTDNEGMFETPVVYQNTEECSDAGNL